MLHLALTVLLVPAPLLAQDPGARALLRPVTSNVHPRTLRLDPATGELTRVTGQVESSGLQVVYDNTCPSGYHLGLAVGLPGAAAPPAAGDWGGLPSTSYAGSAICSTGCADSYAVSEFEIGYCTGSGLAVDMVLHFWDRTALGGQGLSSCDGTALIGSTVPPVVPTVQSLTLSGLPRSSAATANAVCYTVNVNLGTNGFALNGGSSFDPQSTTGDRFSWSMQITNNAGGDGPILAGNAYTGAPCSFCVGTIWQVGGAGSAGATGLGQHDNLWIDLYGGLGSGNCWSFGGPWAGMSLVLEATYTCDDPTAFCDVDDGALAVCPCGNPGKPDTGCDNAQATGGVKLSIVDQALAPNRATLTGTGFPTAGSPTAVVLRSNVLEAGGPTVFGDGVRCIGVTPLGRMSADRAENGVSTHAFDHVAGAGTFHYQLWYRNLPAGFCDPAAGYNLSNGRTLVWP